MDVESYAARSDTGTPAGAREALASAAASVGAMDLFIYRRVTDDRFVHIGGVGRGEGWAGNVDLVLSEEKWARASVERQEPVRRAATNPERVVGTYYERFVVIVPLSRDVVVVFGRSEGGPFASTDAELTNAAGVAVAAIAHVSPAKRLADELELLHRIQELAGMYARSLLMRTRLAVDMLKRELHRAHHDARVDALTGLQNRRAWDEALAQQSEDMPAGVIILDVNDLKLANDEQGHHFGDELLRGVADILRSTVREHDLVARLGGDELAVLLPNASEERCRQVADNVQSAVHKPEGIRGFPLAISIGYATVPPAASLIEAQRLADERMYANKRLLNTDVQTQKRLASDGTGLTVPVPRLDST
jgi:diguanylate cyclase (GGDEF)-like protein